MTMLGRMAAYLLTWDTRTFSWSQRHDYRANVGVVGSASCNWPCGNLASIEPDSLFYLFRHGPNGGIIASGSLLRQPEVRVYSSESGAHETDNAIRVRFKVILEDLDTLDQK